MILLIDNYDSFSYNLYQYVGIINPDIRLIKNDELTLKEIITLKPTHLIVSPGSGKPGDAGICKQVIDYFKDQIPILGVCLGHQAICEVFGAEITYAKILMHGKQSLVYIANGSPIFRGLSPIINVGRYHSLGAKRSTLPDQLLIIAEDDEGEVMAVKHRDFNVFGLQFHPESILTQDGYKMIENFLKIGSKNND